MAIGIVGIMENKASLEEYEREELEARSYVEAEPTERLVEDSGLETDMTEGQERIHEVVRMDDSIENADDTFRSMESLIESLEYHSQNNGINSKAAVYLNHAIESNYRSLGVDYSPEDFVSLEAFNGLETSRVISTEAVAKEQKSKLKEFMQKAWKFIQEMFKKMIEGVKKFFSSIERLKKRAIAIGNEANRLSKEKEKLISIEDNITVSQLKTLGQRLHIKGKSVSLKKAASVLSGYLKKFNNKSSFSDLLKIAEINYNYSKKLVGKGTGSGMSPSIRNPESSITSTVTSSVFNFIGFVTGGKSGSVTAEVSLIKKVWDKGEGNYVNGNHLPGGYSLVGHFTTTGTNEKASPQYEKISASFKKLYPVTKDFTMSKSDLPSSYGDISSITKEVVTICDYYKPAAKNIEDVADKLKDLCKKTNDNLSRAGTDSYIVSKSRQIFSTLRGMSSAVASPMGSFLSYALSTAKFITDQCASFISLSKKRSARSA